VARDEKKNPLVSALDWSAEAVERLFRVPVGFMRTRTQHRVEELASERGAARVELELVEAGLEESRRAMEEFIRMQEQAATVPASSEPSAGRPAAGKCPWHDAASGVVRQPGPAQAARDGLYLNEVGLLSALDAQRKAD
jgi:hypothetical protein